MDVSFVSISKILPAIDKFLTEKNVTIDYDKILNREQIHLKMSLNAAKALQEKSNKEIFDAECFFVYKIVQIISESA